MEENVFDGGYGEKILKCINENEISCEILNIAIPDCYVEHGNDEVLKKELRIDADSVVERILDMTE